MEVVDVRAVAVQPAADRQRQAVGHAVLMALLVGHQDQDVRRALAGGPGARRGRQVGAGAGGGGAAQEGAAVEAHACTRPIAAVAALTVNAWPPATARPWGALTV